MSHPTASYPPHVILGAATAALFRGVPPTAPALLVGVVAITAHEIYARAGGPVPGVIQSVTLPD